MKLTENDALQIAEEYKNAHAELTNNIIRADFNSKYDVIGGNAWIVTGEFEIFGEIREFWYVISDETGEVEYTFDEYGNRDPHIPIPTPKEWEDYIDDDL